MQGKHLSSWIFFTDVVTLVLRQNLKSVQYLNVIGNHTKYLDFNILKIIF